MVISVPPNDCFASCVLSPANIDMPADTDMHLHSYQQLIARADPRKLIRLVSPPCGWHRVHASCLSPIASSSPPRRRSRAYRRGHGAGAAR